MRPHHLHACVHSVRCVWLWKDIAFSKELLFWKIHFGECQNLTNSNLGIWSIAQKRYPNLSYASKRDCASIAPHTKLKKEIAKILQTLFSCLRAGQNSGRGTIFHFCGPKTKNKKIKVWKIHFKKKIILKKNYSKKKYIKYIFGQSIKKRFFFKKNPIWKNQLYIKIHFWKIKIWKSIYLKMNLSRLNLATDRPVEPFAHICAKSWNWSGGHQIQCLCWIFNMTNFF